MHFSNSKKASKPSRYFSLSWSVHSVGRLIRTYLHTTETHHYTHLKNWELYIKWADRLSVLLEVSYKALDPAEFEGLLCGVAFKLEAALQVSVSEVVNECADNGGHQVLFCDQHPSLEN